MNTDDQFELNRNAKNIFYNSNLPIIINIVNFLDIEPLLNLLISVFAYKVEESYTFLFKPSWSASEVTSTLFYKLPYEIILMCLKKIKTPILFKLCMLYPSFWDCMMMIPVKNFNFNDYNSEYISEFLTHIKSLNDDKEENYESITNFVINIFLNGLSINTYNKSINECRSVFCSFLTHNELFLESINFNGNPNFNDYISCDRDYTFLVFSLFNIDDPDRFEII
jgi:hypothetical protein